METNGITIIVLLLLLMAVAIKAWVDIWIWEKPIEELSKITGVLWFFILAGFVVETLILLIQHWK